MVNKKLALGIFVMSLAHLPTSGQTTCFESGFIAGAQVGIANGRGTFHSTFDTNLIGVSKASKRAHKNSAVFDFFGGYRHIFCEGYTLGVNISADVYSKNNIKAGIVHVFRTPTPPFINKISRRYSIIPAINVGKVVCDCWHVALGLGLAISEFHQKVNEPLLDPSLPLNTVKSSKTKIGFVPSVSGEYALSQCVSLTGNLSYEIYRKVSKRFGDQLTRPIFPGSSYVSSIRPRYLTLKFGAAYRF